MAEPTGSRRRDDGPLPAPLLVYADSGLWQAGYRDWDADGHEYRVDGEMFDNQRAAWERSQQMVAAERARRGAKPTSKSDE